MANRSPFTSLSLVLLAGIASCSEPPSERSGGDLPANASGPWRIHISAAVNGRTQTIDIPPLLTEKANGEEPTEAENEVFAPDYSELIALVPDAFKSRFDDWRTGAPISSQSYSPGTSTQGTIDNPGEFSFDQGNVNTAVGSSGQLAWLLVHGAVRQCQAEANVPALSADNFPPWGKNKWHFFGRPPSNCDDALYMEETFLCVADKLLEVTDAVQPITWDKVGAISVSSSQTVSGPWTIPVQATLDKFIARDLALHVLAQIPRTDTYPIANFSKSRTSGTCTAYYADFADREADAAYSPAVLTELFGVASFGGKPTRFPAPLGAVDGKKYASISRTRLARKASVLRAADRLLKRSVESGVYADLSGASTRRGHAADAVRGSRLAWGTGTDGPYPYNSLAHSTRMIFGRWEMGPNSGDPKCSRDVASGSRIGELDLLRYAYGRDISARAADITVTTAGRQVASALIDGAGIVIPAKVLASQSASVIRAAVEDQLVSLAAVRNGVDAGDSDFASNGEGQRIKKLLSEIHDEDLLFALERSFRTYRLLTNQGDEISSLPTNVAGIHAGTTNSPLLLLLHGFAIDGGLPTDDLTIDFAARAGGFQVASQCGEDGTSPAGSFLNAWAADGTTTTSYQDAFSLGQAYARRLTVLRENLERHPLPSDVAGGSATSQSWADLLNSTKSSIAEARSWAGRGRFILWPAGNDGSGGPNDLFLVAVGFLPEDWGASSPADMANQIELVYGEPFLADCAAGLRSSCPVDTSGGDHIPVSGASYGIVPTTSVVAATSNDLQLAEGADGVTGYFDFKNWPTNPYFHPKYANGDWQEKHLYVVLKRDPKNNRSKGKVLGALEIRGEATSGRSTSVTVSDLQRGLSSGSIGVGDKVLALYLVDAASAVFDPGR